MHFNPHVSSFGVQIRYWRKYDDNEAAASRVIVHRTNNQTRLENMRPDSHYLIEVRAFNGAGLGPPSEHCEMFTRRPRKRFDLLYITLIQILQTRGPRSLNVLIIHVYYLSSPKSPIESLQICQLQSQMALSVLGSHL